MKLRKPPKYMRHYYDVFYFEVPNSEYFFVFEHFDNGYIIWEWVKEDNLEKK